MKPLIYPFLCLLCTANAFAAPAAPTASATSKITEIRLKDYPGYGPNGHLSSEIVLRADNNLYWVKGIGKDAIRHRYTLKAGEFQKVTQALKTYGFFDLKPAYGPMVADAPNFTLGAKRDGKDKEVVYVYNNLPAPQPFKLWTMEKIVRGVAMQTIAPEPARAID